MLYVLRTRAVVLHVRKLISGVAVHPDHLQLRNNEATLRDGRQDSADVVVGIWLDHRQSTTLPVLQSFAGVFVGVVNNLELTGKYSDGCSDVHVRKGDLSIFSALQEGPVVLWIKH